jgi:hypothetical protein
VTAGYTLLVRTKETYFRELYNPKADSQEQRISRRLDRISIPPVECCSKIRVICLHTCQQLLLEVPNKLENPDEEEIERAFVWTVNGANCGLL